MGTEHSCERQRVSEICSRIGVIERILSTLATAINAAHCMYGPWGVLVAVGAISSDRHKMRQGNGGRHSIDQPMEPALHSRFVVEHVMVWVW